MLLARPVEVLRSAVGAKRPHRRCWQLRRRTGLVAPNGWREGGTSLVRPRAERLAKVTGLERRAGRTRRKPCKNVEKAGFCKGFSCGVPRTPDQRAHIHTCFIAILKPRFRIFAACSQRPDERTDRTTMHNVHITSGRATGGLKIARFEVADLEVGRCWGSSPATADSLYRSASNIPSAAMSRRIRFRAPVVQPSAMKGGQGVAVQLHQESPPACRRAEIAEAQRAARAWLTRATEQIATRITAADCLRSRPALRRIRGFRRRSPSG